MIKYDISMGDKALNTIARHQRDAIYKPRLKGMHCRQHTENTIIRFYPYGSTVNGQIHACCAEFEGRIREKLKS